MDDEVIEVSTKSEKREKEKGAIIVEAVLSLTFFMFTMITVLSLIQIAYTQARMSVSLGCATKQLAQYMHIYYEAGLDDALSATGGKSSELFGKVGELVETVGGKVGSVGAEIKEFADAFSRVAPTTSAQVGGTGTVISEVGSAISGGGQSVANTSVAEVIMNEALQPIIKKMLYNELKTGGYASGEEFLEKNRVEKLDFHQSSFMEDGGDNIYIQASYDIKVIKLLNIDYSFHFTTWAYTTAWGK